MTWTRIICHHSASPDNDWMDAADIDRWHRDRGWRRVGYHRLVEKVSGKYQCVMGRPAYMVGSHCRGWNSTALGVCFVGNFDEETMPPEQLETGAEALAELCIAYGILPESIWMHRDCGSTACPGRHFPTYHLVQKVNQKIQSKEV